MTVQDPTARDRLNRPGAWMSDVPYPPKPRSDRERLGDILTLAAEIARSGDTRELLDTEPVARRSLARLIQCVGQAIIGLSYELTVAYPDVPWGEFVERRDRVLIRYYDLDLDDLWRAASVDVPRLAERVTKILGEWDGQCGWVD